MPRSRTCNLSKLIIRYTLAEPRPAKEVRTGGKSWALCSMSWRIVFDNYMMDKLRWSLWILTRSSWQTVTVGARSGWMLKDNFPSVFRRETRLVWIGRSSSDKEEAAVGGWGMCCSWLMCERKVQCEQCMELSLLLSEMSVRSFRWYTINMNSRG